MHQVFSNNLPLFAEKDLLQNAHLTIPLGEFLCAVGPGDDQAAGQRQRPGGCPWNPLFHGVMGEPTGHLKCLPVHHQLSFGSLTKVFDLVHVDYSVIKSLLNIFFRWFTDPLVY